MLTVYYIYYHKDIVFKEFAVVVPVARKKTMMMSARYFYGKIMLIVDWFGPSCREQNG